MRARKPTAPKPGKNTSLEPWSRDAACSIRGAKRDLVERVSYGPEPSGANQTAREGSPQGERGGANQNLFYKTSAPGIVLFLHAAKPKAEIVASLGRQLVDEFGNGFAEKSLRRMVQFAEVFPDSEIVVSLIRQLSWTHILALIPLKQPLQRDFYAEMCRVELWSVRTLRAKIDSMLYERTAISKQPEDVARGELAALCDEDKLTSSLVFRDPYILDFLGLRDRYL